MNMHLPIVLGHCLPTNYQIAHVNLLTLIGFTSLSSFVHVSIQASELHEHTCPIAMLAEVVFMFSKPCDIYLFPVHQQTLSLYKVSHVGLFWLVRFVSST